MKKFTLLLLLLITTLILGGLSASCGGPETAIDYVNQGVTDLEKGKYDNAIANFNLAIELDPNLALPYENRGFAYAAKGEYKKAQADFNKEIALSLSLDGLPVLGHCIQLANRAIELDPNFAWAYFGQGMAYRAQDKNAEAIAALEKYIELSQDPSLTQLAQQLLEELRS